MSNEVIKFVGLDKRDSIRQAVSYYRKSRKERNMEEFLAKCRLQKDGITVHYYPDLIVDIIKYREYVERTKQKGKNEDKYTTRYRWSFGKLLSWFRGLFK